MQLTPEEKDIGQENYYSAVSELSARHPDITRRDFLRTALATGAVSGAGLGAMYFGYKEITDPVRVAVIGTGDEGQVLIGAHNPNYVQVVAICEIRPYNIHRAFHGDWASDVAVAARPGLMSKYGFTNEDAAKEKIKVYTDYKDVLKDPDIEGIIIALPLHLHAIVAVEALQAGKHVLTEKLMAHNVAQCKVMGRVANKQDLYLGVGHQRHYSVLYDNAVNLLKWGLLGELHTIRAQWHRDNLPGGDSWRQPLPGGEKGWDGEGKETVIDEIKKKVDDLRTKYEKIKDKDSDEARMTTLQLAQWMAWDSDKDVIADNYGYQPFKLSDGRARTALEELCRWRLWARTGGGLMAELGSHQLDAASIFCSALRKDGNKAHPLGVHAVGGRYTFPLDRDAEDHVFCMFEFPAPGYLDEEWKGPKPKDNRVGYYDSTMNYPSMVKGDDGKDYLIPPYEADPNKRIMVTYSSIMGNGFGGYGEVVMGTKGTLVLEREQDIMLYKNSATTSKVGVKDDKGGPTLDTQASGKQSVAKAVQESGPVSRGYTEEIEHWAWCIRNGKPSSQPKENLPRCRAEIALGDGVIALASNVAIANGLAGKGGYLKFEESWFDLNEDATPDGSTISDEASKLGADL